MKVNVGTIGHIDHGKTTLIAALSQAGLLDKVLIVDDARATELNSHFNHLADIDIPASAHGLVSGRAKDAARKATRKSRMRELQRKAFCKESG